MDDVASTDEDTDLMATVITNDTDVDGPDTLITLVTDVTNGTLVLDTDGSYTYTPDADFNGTDSFTYSYCDGGTPEACDTAMVTITVDPVNDDPVITDTDGTPMDTLFVQVPEDGSDTTCVSVMDVDGDVTTCTLIDPVSGTAMLLDDTCVVYNPLPEYSGPDTLSKIACDGSGACDTIVIVYEVLPVNDAPDAMNDVASTDEDTDLMATVITNDTDVDGPDTLITLVTDVTNGTLVLDTDGSYTYTPDADFNGTDSFTYSYCDGGTPEACDTAMVTITVDPVNDDPVITDTDGTPMDTLFVQVPEDGSDTTCVSVMDVDGDVTTCTLIDPVSGTAMLLDDTCVVYNPLPEYSGPDTLSKIACDGSGACDTIVIVYEVLPVNDAPDAMDDVASTDEDTELMATVITNDTDVDGPDTSITLVTDVTNGTLVLDTDGSYTYTPNADFNGTDSFTYSYCDGGTPEACDTAMVTITVDPVNDDPVITDTDGTPMDTLFVQVPEDGSDTTCVSVMDVDGDVTTCTLIDPVSGTAMLLDDTCVVYNPLPEYSGPDTLSKIACDGSGACDTIVIVYEVLPVNDAPDAMNDVASTDEDTDLMATVITNDTDVDGPDTLITLVTDVMNGILVLDTDGSYTYTPDANFTGTDSFTYSYCDGGTPELCDTAMVTIMVLADNLAPVANDDEVDTDEDVILTGDVSANDEDVTGPDTVITLVTDVVNGTLDLNEDGTFTYVPDGNFNGLDSFIYSYCDGGVPELCDTAVVVITVNPVNDAPVANDDVDVSVAGVPVATDVLANDTDVDGNVDPGSVTVVEGPANGSVTINTTTGVITYTPDIDFVGVDSYVYAVCDDGTPLPVQCDSATVTIIVSPNDVNLGCISNINVTLDEDCAATLIPSMILTGEFDGANLDLFEVSVIDNLGTDSIINGCGEYNYMIRVRAEFADVISNFAPCWGIVNAEDKTPPAVTALPVAPALFCTELDEVELASLESNISRCWSVTNTGAFISYRANFQSQPVTNLNRFLTQTELGRRLVRGGGLPTVTDGCSETLEVCVNDVIQRDPLDPQCNDVLVTRRFTVTETGSCISAAGEDNDSTTDDYVLTFVRPDLDDLDGDAIDAVAEYECDDPTIVFGTNPAPRAQDFPFLEVGGRVFPLSDGANGETVCNIGVTFEDGPRIVTCPNTYKFVRTYTVIDWCEPGDIRTFTQVVKVGDTMAPTFTGPRQFDFQGNELDGLTFSTNAGNICAAYIRLDDPTITVADNCSANIFITADIYPGGDLTATPIGTFVVDLNDGNAEISSAIPVGDHVLRYTVRDDCGNEEEFDFDFSVVDRTAPVAICEDGLNISITAGQSQTDEACYRHRDPDAGDDRQRQLRRL